MEFGGDLEDLKDDPDDYKEYLRLLHRKTNQEDVINQVRPSMVQCGVRDVLLNAVCDPSLPVFIKEKCQQAYVILSTVVPLQDPWSNCTWLPSNDVIPGIFMCPITRLQMTDPVMTSDGHTYERKAIEKWFADGNNTSPSTGCALVSLTVVPNYSIKKGMDQWRLKHTGREGLKKHVAELTSSILCAKDETSMLNIVNQIKTLVSGGGSGGSESGSGSGSGHPPNVSMGPLMSKEEVTRLSAIASSLVKSMVGQKRKSSSSHTQGSGGEDGENGEGSKQQWSKTRKNEPQASPPSASQQHNVQMATTLAAIQSLETVVTKNIEKYQNEYRSCMVLEQSRLQKEQDEVVVQEQLVKEMNITENIVQDMDDKLKQAQHALLAITKKSEFAKQQHREAKTKVAQQVKKVECLQKLGCQLASDNEKRIAVLRDVGGECMPEDEGEGEGEGGEEEEEGDKKASVLGKRKNDGNDEGNGEENSEGKNGGGSNSSSSALSSVSAASSSSKRLKTQPSSQANSSANVGNGEWLFREGHALYWGTGCRPRDVLKGRLMVEVAAQHNNAAARMYCMYHGWNNQLADADGARKVYEDMVVQGYPHQLVLSPSSALEKTGLKKSTSTTPSLCPVFVDTSEEDEEEEEEDEEEEVERVVVDTLSSSDSEDSDGSDSSDSSDDEVMLF